MGKLKLTAWVLAAMLATVALRADSASAVAPLVEFSATTTSSQAGGHPNLSVHIKVKENAIGEEAPRDVRVEFPAGFIGNPHVVPTCTSEQFSRKQCPPSSQVGLEHTVLSLAGFTFVSPIYNMQPSPDQAGLLAFYVPFLGLAPVYIELSARTGGDFGLNAETKSITQFGSPAVFDQYLWGVPADPVHDPVRLTPGSRAGQWECNAGGEEAWEQMKNDIMPPTSSCSIWQEGSFNPPTKSDSLPGPLVSSPTTCVGPLTATATTTSYDNLQASAISAFPATTGCDQLQFNPSLAANPTTTWTDTASGLEVDLTVPQFQSPTTPSPSYLKGLTVEMPEGFSINPNAADGKVVCTDAQAKFGSEDAAECPEFAKVGTSIIDSSALPAPIPGAVYLGEPKPGDRYRLLITADGFGTHVKVPGSVRPDPDTGRLTVEFEDLPQAPLQRTQLHMFGSERGVLATPTQCGTYPVKTTFEPYADELGSRKATQFFILDTGPNGAPCPPPSRGFGPVVEAGSDNNTAARFTNFGFEASRADGEQFIDRLEVTLPPGFTAKLAGVPYCPESALATISNAVYTGATELGSPACPVASQIGTVSTEAGAGTRPLTVTGRAFLAGPYKGAPLSILFVVPAVSGPYDLGVVAVRTAIFVDPVSARVHAVSDPLPRILDGIPLRLRHLQVSLNRSEFSLNPTNCDPFSVTSTLTGDQGGSSSASSHFQVADCGTLAYGPKLTLKLTGGLKRRGHPAIHAKFRAGFGESNSRGVQLLLPMGEQLDNSHIRTICTRVQFAQGACPGGSQIGRATATTPLLDSPLSGPVYLRSSNNKLPDLVVDLRGQVDVELSAKIDSVNGRLRSTFEAIPDVPVTQFVLDLEGGKRGLLLNSETLCGTKKRATARMTGQNGAVVSRKVALKPACGKAGTKKRKRHQHQARKAGQR